MQVVEAEPDANEPAAHKPHDELACARAAEPGGHGKQASVSLADEYQPALHDVQPDVEPLPRGVPKEPGMHVRKTKSWFEPT